MITIFRSHELARPVRRSRRGTTQAPEEIKLWRSVPAKREMVPTAGRWCTGKDALSGSWQPLRSKQHTRWRDSEPPCCSWDVPDNASPLCPNGRWAVRTAFEAGLAPFTATLAHLAPVGARACSCARTRDHQMAYQWVPSRCYLPKFDASTFCGLLGHHRT